MDATPNSEIRVRGEAEVRCMPDRAILRVGVEAEADSQAEAYALASQSAVAVDAVLDRFDQVVDRRLTAGVIVRPKTRWRKGETVRTGWIAARTTVVEVTTFIRLGALVAELPQAGASTLQGPMWTVDKSNPAYDQARRAAVLDAERRASTYAQALGLRLGALKWLAEPGLRADSSGQPGFGAMARLSHAVAEVSDEAMDITPDEITIQATVEACFAVEDRHDTDVGGHASTIPDEGDRISSP
jgi:uncharacterized protein YggE